MSWRDRAVAVDGKSQSGWRARAIPAEKFEEGPETSASEAALESYGNSATLGYLPHLQALAGKVMPNPSADADEELRRQGFEVPDSDQSYLEMRDANLNRQKKQKEEHPVASGVGSLAGMAASAILPAGAVSKGASLGTKALQGAKAAGAYGALTNPGDVEGEIDPLQLGDRAKNAAIGGAIGAAMPVALAGASKASSKVSDYLKKKAELKATRALGRPTPKLAEKMAASGQDAALGRELLDEGAIPVLGTPKRIATRVEKLKDKAGEEIGDLVSRGGNEKLVDAEKMAIEILDSPELAQMRKTPGMENTVAQIEKQIETLAQNKTMTLKEAQSLRQGIDKSINFNKSAPEMRGAQEGLYKQRTAIRDAMNDAIDKLPGAEGKNALLKANRKYGNMSQAEDILEREIGRDQSNRSISLTDTIAGAAGLASGQPILAPALALANKAGRTFGNSVQARVYDTISKKLAGAGKAAGAASPIAASLMAQRIAAGQPGIEKDADPILNDERLMELFKKDPTLIDSISDERTKSKVRRAIAGGK